MMLFKTLVLLLLGSLVNCQSPGAAKSNTLLKMPIEICQSEGNCQKGKNDIILHMYFIDDILSVNPTFLGF